MREKERGDFERGGGVLQVREGVTTCGGMQGVKVKGGAEGGRGKVWLHDTVTLYASHRDADRREPTPRAAMRRQCWQTCRHKSPPYCLVIYY